VCLDSVLSARACCCAFANSSFEGDRTICCLCNAFKAVSVLLPTSDQPPEPLHRRLESVRFGFALVFASVHCLRCAWIEFAPKILMIITAPGILHRNCDAEVLLSSQEVLELLPAAAGTLQDLVMSRKLFAAVRTMQ
jgi:hypothetical protein